VLDEKNFVAIYGLEKRKQFRHNQFMKFQKIFFVSFLFLVLFVPQILRAASEETSVAQAEAKVYTVIEFESTFMNRRKEEILKTLGEPDSKNQVQEREVWKYNQLVKDKGQIWDQNIMFDFGRVNYIWSDQPTAGGNRK
jgi:hypothetical protein